MNVCENSQGMFHKKMEAKNFSAFFTALHQVIAWTISTHQFSQSKMFFYNTYYEYKCYFLLLYGESGR
jgi:hypothetical protein